MPRYKSHPRKGRSSAQKAHTLSLLAIPKRRVQPNTPSRLPNTSNNNAVTHSPVPSDLSQAYQKKDQLKMVQSKLKNTVQREKRSRAKVTNLESTLDMAKASSSNIKKLESETQVLKCSNHALEAKLHTKTEDLQVLQGNLATVSQNEVHISTLLAQTTAQLHDAENQSHILRERNDTLMRGQDALRKRRARAQQAGTANRSIVPNTPQPRPLTLKDSSGIICPGIRDLLRQLASEGVSTKRMMDVIRHVAGAAGLDVTDSISPRSISRAVLEGLVQAQMQVAYEISQADWLSICGDGTGIKNQQHEAKLIRIPAHTSTISEPPDDPPSKPTTPPPLRTLGVHKSPGHSAQSQLDGWKKIIDSCCELLNASPLGQDIRVNSRIFGARLRAVLTDHASDQKLLAELLRAYKVWCDRELRGEAILEKLSSEEQLQALSGHLEASCRTLGEWENLSAKQQDRVKHDAWSALALTLGEGAFETLSVEEKRSADCFFWTGCCMHKDLNAVKGGVAALSSMWDKLDAAPPIPLKNKFESAKPDKENDHTATSKTTKQDPSRGGVKLTSLAGAVFNHKDDKKGQQNTYRYYFENHLTYSVSFPDTSNTRYGSHCAAAVELLVNREIYLQFLRDARDAKTVAGFTNIEKNIYDGLQDSATLTDLASLAIYSQVISVPYMTRVRSGAENALGLRVLHEEVKDCCRVAINNPDLLLSPDASSGTCTLGGQPWDRPDVAYYIASISHELPHLRDALVAFFRGALEVWERFTSEFAPDGTVAQASHEERSSVWNSATNDASEGALGQCRQMLRRQPAITDNQRNGRVMWKQNDTRHFVEEHFTSPDHSFVRREARRIDASGVNQQIRQEQNNAMIERVKAHREQHEKALEKRSVNEQRLANIHIRRGATKPEIEKLTVRELDDQIDKIREIDNELPVKSKFRLKVMKVDAVMQALERLKKLATYQQSCKGKEKAIGEYMMSHEEELRDEEMCFADEVQMCA